MTYELTTNAITICMLIRLGYHSSMIQNDNNKGKAAKKVDTVEPKFRYIIGKS